MQHRTTRCTLFTRTSALLVAAVTAGAVPATTGTAQAIRKVVAKIRSKEKAGKTFKKGITEVFEEAGAGIGGMAAGVLGVDGVIKHCW
ncbi:hypothetical protein [Streptomyces sp. bgisy022]|uniref:hypothetical protein n=1 Tax=Streptomyces sp. bgisy022 TaxID=3413769 RepID=UPI003D7397F5